MSDITPSSTSTTSTDVQTLDSQSTLTIYVPPNPTPDASAGGETRRTCVRIGMADTDAGSDEVTTYDAIRSGDALFALPSTSDYQNLWAGDGVTMLTSGWISFYAEKGVSTAASETNIQTAGNTYTVTVDPSSYEVISASLVNTSANRWLTTSFTQGGTIAVNDNYQAGFALGANYALQSGLVLSNGLSLGFSCGVGAAVSMPLALSVSVGNNSVSSSWPFGDSFSYQQEFSQTAAKISFLVDSNKTNAGLALVTAKQNLFVIVAKAAVIACEAAGTVYAASAMGVANQGGSTSGATLFEANNPYTLRPHAMKEWLLTAEPVAITATSINALLGAMGAILGIIQLAASKVPPVTGTTMTLGDGTIELSTGGVSPAQLATLNLDKTNGLSVQTPVGKVALSVGPPASPSTITVAPASIDLALGTAKATLSPTQIDLSVGAAGIIITSNSVMIRTPTGGITLGAAGIALNGTKIAVNAPQTAFQAAPQMPAAPIIVRRPPPPIPPRPKKAP
jgi:hypothetical protein